MIHLAYRPEKNVRIKDMEYRIGGRGLPGGASPDSLVTVIAKRIGIEKRGDDFSLWISVDGEPMHQFGPPILLHLDAPFYVGIGFCSHLPDNPTPPCSPMSCWKTPPAKFTRLYRHRVWMKHTGWM